MAALYDSLNAMFTQIANDVKLLFSSKANKNGETFTGPITISSAGEAQVHVDKSSQPTAYLYSNDSAWGLFSSAGGMIIGYNRITTKTLVGGIETSEIVRNNLGTYAINISASAAKLNGQTASYYTDIPARLGYTPVQQGTGVGQSANAVKIGWDASSKLKATVDNTHIGNFAFEAWVSQQIANLVASSPAALDTLNELASALGNDPNFASTMVNALAGKASKNGDTFTGNIQVNTVGEAQVQVNTSGQASAYLFSSAADWGLFSANNGDYIIRYSRGSGKVYIGGVDTSEIVKNNNGTYSLNINGTASNLVGGNPYQIASLGVGTTPSAIPGTILAAGDIRGFFSSDATLKENIRCIENPIYINNQLRGVRFDWTDAYIKENGGIDDYFLRKNDVGVIADDVEKVLPELVSVRPNGKKAVKYDRLVAVSIECIKVLDDRLKEQETTISSLTNSLRILSEKINLLESKINDNPH